MNRVILCGNLTKDVELKSTQSGKKIVDFSIAINEGKDKTEFIDCQAWEKTAEVISQYFSKGSKILVEGRLATYVHENEEGKKTKRTYVVIERVEFVERKKKEETPKEITPTNNEVTIDPNELPFF